MTEEINKTENVHYSRTQ